MSRSVPGDPDAGARGAGGWMAASAATLFWGLSFVGVRVALAEFRPLGLVGLRLSIAAPILGLLLLRQGGGLLPRGRDRALCALLGLILAVHLSIQTVAMQSTTATRAGFFVAFIPVVVALGAMLFLRERMRRWGWLGVALATLGVLTLSSVRPADLAQVGRGDALMLLSCFTWAAYTLISVPVVRRCGALRVTTCAMAVAALPCLALGLREGLWSAAPSRDAWAALLFLGLFASAAAFLAFGFAIKALGAQRTAAFLYVQPFVTLLAARLLLDEPFTFGSLLGGLIVLAGVFVIQRAKRGLN